MKLTDTERLILRNQYRILEVLSAGDDAETRWNRRAQTILERGYEYHYDDLAGAINPKTVPAEESEEVLDILNLFRALKFSYRDLADKTGIKEGLIDFWGFDATYEQMQFHYARFFCAPEEGKFEELEKGDGYNSHARTLPMYRKMLARWDEMGRSHELTKEQILKITEP